MRKALVAIGLAAFMVLCAPAATAQESSLTPAPERVSLQEALRRAFARHPSAALAQEEIRRAQALVRESRASSLPTLTGNITLTRLDSDRTMPGRVIAAANQQSANLVLSVPLVAPQRWANWSHAKDNLEVANASAADVRRVLAVNTARAYLAIISQRRILEVNARAVATAKAHYEFAKAQFEGGVGNRIDQVRAEQQVASLENQSQLALVATAKAQEALGVLLGEAARIDAADDAPLPATPPLATALNETDSLRTDVSVARARQRAAQNLVNDGWTDFMPLLLGTFQPFYQHPSTLTQPQWGWQAQLLLSVPFYDGGLRYGLADERKALASSTRVQVEQSLRQARSEVRLAYETVQKAEVALASARRAAKLANEALELANLAYKAGASTNLEVIDAERQARDQETLTVVAEDTARQARLDLLAASGRFP